MILSRLRDELDRHGVRYQTLAHDRTTTAAGVAAAAGVREDHVVKSVLIVLDGVPTLVLVTAGARVDLQAVCRFTGARRAHLADELTCAGSFPDCEAGAQPALGHLYQLPVLADEELAAQPEIIFNAGTHTQAVRMTWAAFERLSRPRVGAFADRAVAALA